MIRPDPRTSRTSLLVLAIAAALLGGACGDSGGGGGSAPDTTTEEVGGMVASSSWGDDGRLNTTIWDADQANVLAYITYDPASGVMLIEHRALGFTLDYQIGTADVSDLNAWNASCVHIFGMIPSSLEDEVVGYDGFGCDAPANGFSCGSRGNCCDVHDGCYDRNECTYASWVCAAAVATCRFGAGIPKILACTSAALCSGPNKSLACASCNGVAAACFLGIGGTGQPSNCCGKPTTGANCTGCGCDRPDDCNTLPNGCCASNPSCDPPPDPNDPPPDPNDPPPDPDDPDDPGPDDPCWDCDPGGPGRPGGPGGPGGGTGGPLHGPTDPNEKRGPAGEGPERTVSATSALPYTILFENDADLGATVPAQEVVVVDYLDADLDWSTVAFSEINVGGRTLVVPPGVTQYTLTDIPPNDGCVIFGEAEGQLAVEVNLGINVQTGRIELRLKVIDTATGDWPWDPFAGILPPDGTVCANGHMTFSVRPRADVPVGVQITNRAAIVFDYEAAINTNEVWNTLGP